MKKYKVGIVGSGFIGAVHVETLRRLPNIEVVALTDSNNAREKADALNIPYAFSHYQEMLDQVELDSIHICTPNFTHYEIAMAAMEKGIHVLCEKPMAFSTEEASLMLAKAIEKKVVHGVNFHNRFYPVINHLKNVVKENQLGEIFSIHGGYIQDWLLNQTDYSWRLVSKESGKTRAVADIGSHWVDIVEFITGLKAVEVFAEFKIVYEDRLKPIKPIATFSKATLSMDDYEKVPMDTEDIACIMIRFDNGAIGNATIHQMFAGKKNKITVFIAGKDMSVEWDSDNSNNAILGRRDEWNLTITKDPSLLHPASSSLSSYPGGHVEGFGDAFRHGFIAFYDKIENLDKENDFATFVTGKRIMLICDKLYESAQTHTWVKI